ncbi:efflux RND transporter periplasmic adaptor subunit [Acetobacter sp.]|uniref:efflux RND transporter periplasmic adaptor subunit n=1 Tax=Acetobacter sp. TaxID=440 RepID=UPI0039EB8A4D
MRNIRFPEYTMYYHSFSKYLLHCAALVPLLYCTACKPASNTSKKTSSTPVEAIKTVEERQNLSIFTGTYSMTRSMPLASAQAGRIASTLVTSGQFVRKGQALVTFDNTAALEGVAQAEGELEAAHADATQSALLSKRSRGLDTVGGLSTEMVEARAFSAKASHGKRSAALASLHQAQIQAAETVVRAPEDGLITSVSGVPGSVTDAGREVVRLASGDPEVRIYALSTSPMKVGDEAWVNTLPDPAHHFVHAVIREIDGAADVTNQMRGIRLTLDKPLPVAVNTAVRVTFTSPQDRFLARVPLTALIDNENDTAHLWVITKTDEKSRTVLRQVNVIALRGADALVKGLQSGEIIVASGADTLKSNQIVKIADLLSEQ